MVLRQARDHCNGGGRGGRGSVSE